VLIRDADPARDGAACAAIYAPCVSSTVISLEEEPPDAAEMARRIETIVARYPWLVAEADGTVIGYAYGAQHRDRAAYRWAADVAVYVAEGRRGQSVGTQLYSALLPLLARQDLRIACAGVTLPNQASVALHESFGFEPVGIYRRIAFKQGRWHDVGWWQLELPAAGGDPPPDPTPPVRLAQS
jgi:phosphinothricin acetyltransferase